jgi:RNA polymerase sigma-70 factor, ECF subfamily
MDRTSNEATHLIEQLRAGDRRALGELFYHYCDRLRRMVELRMDPRLRARLDASDVLREAHLEPAGDRSRRWGGPPRRLNSLRFYFIKY